MVDQMVRLRVVKYSPRHEKMTARSRAHWRGQGKGETYLCHLGHREGHDHPHDHHEDHWVLQVGRRVELLALLKILRGFLSQHPSRRLWEKGHMGGQLPREGATSNKPASLLIQLQGAGASESRGWRAQHETRRAWRGQARDGVRAALAIRYDRFSLTGGGGGGWRG